MVRGKVVTGNCNEVDMRRMRWTRRRVNRMTSKPGTFSLAKFLPDKNNG